jgi:hypothetical protein
MKPTKLFIKHCEINLIQYRIAQGLSPVEIRANKLCGAACNAQWTDGVNARHYNKRWFVSGCNGKVYMSSREDNPTRMGRIGVLQYYVDRRSELFANPLMYG